MNIERVRLLAKTAVVFALLGLQTSGGNAPAAATRPQPVAVWHLDERTGRTARDGSGHGHDGSIRGAVTLGIDGKFGTAYRFLPRSNVVVRDAPDLRPGTAPIRISYWLKLTTRPPATTDYDLFVKGNSASRGGQIKLEVEENGQALCMFRGALGQKKLQAGPKVTDGRWHHVTCERVGDQIIETVDRARFSGPKPTGAITVRAPIVLGSHLRRGDWYEGALDEVRYSIASDTTTS